MRAIARLLLHGIALWSATLVAAEWNVEMVAPGTKPEIAVGDDGTVHIAYIEESESGAVYYARRSPDGWSIEIPHTGYFYAPLDIDVDGAGVVHIAYHDHDREDASLAAKDASGWTVENIAHSGHDGWDPTLVVDSAGRIHVVSIDPSQFGPDAGIEYALRDDRFDGSTWQIETVVEETASDLDLGQLASLALDGSGRPHIRFYELPSSPIDSLGTIYYARGSVPTASRRVPRRSAGRATRGGSR